jgi:hypothetical protein
MNRKNYIYQIDNNQRDMNKVKVSELMTKCRRKIDMINIAREFGISYIF